MKNNMNIVANKKIFYAFSVILIILSFVSIGKYGIKLGIDFTGGSILEVSYVDDLPAKNIVEEKLNSFDLGAYVLRETGENGYSLKSKSIDDATKNSIVESLSFDGANTLEVKRFNTIGPTLGQELKTKATVSLLVVLLAIILFIAYTFRQVSKPVSSWRYGFVAIFALIHDIIVTIGFFSLMGGLYGVEIDTLFATALLVILGYSINDTIVVLDRVRENLRDISDGERKKNFPEIVNKSLVETFGRSINASLTTLFAVLALYFIGGPSTTNFALALIVGIISGTYSSIFLAAPMLVSFKEKQGIKDGK